MAVGNKELLDSSMLKISHQHRYGLIGRNGVGKTTLMHRIAAGQIEGMRGSSKKGSGKNSGGLGWARGKKVSFSKHIRTLLVRQEVAGSSADSALKVWRSAADFWF